MDMFECGGWVTIWTSPEESDCFVRIRHLDCHQKYVCIDVPEDVKKFIAENTKLRAPQLWKEILKIYLRPNFTQKAVYNHWFKQQQANWRRCNDEFESAKILLQAFATDPAHELVSIPMPESDGFHALGFVFPSVLRKWDGVIREVALDSTSKTNKAGFECFALLGEPDLNKKEKYLRAAIRFITVVWHIRTKQKHLKVAQTAIPTLKLRLTGQTSEVPAPARQKIVIHLNGRLERAPHSESLGDSDEALQSYVDSLDDVIDDEEDLDEDPDAVDWWDGPAPIFEPGSTRSSEKIRYDAVWETYQFCFQRGLREVWGYMWTAWYCPTKFRLWNFWRNLKHETLHHFVHPRLDQLVYLIAVEVLPYTEAKMQIFETDFRPGRAKALTPYCKAFKKCWKMLAQKYNAFLLCKHLVQAFDPPHKTKKAAPESLCTGGNGGKISADGSYQWRRRYRCRWAVTATKKSAGRLVDGEVLSETWEINVTAIKLRAIVGGIAFSLMCHDLPSRFQVLKIPPGLFFTCIGSCVILFGLFGSAHGLDFDNPLAAFAAQATAHKTPAAHRWIPTMPSVTLLAGPYHQILCVCYHDSRPW
ncbi:hypothetical protein B0H14DRAFT_3867552 [Mycena olivaceomarginata]|nr:hypothetical protein B0H14DRAFT_3867552 [Mycena olivaceomarginata]